MGKPKKSQAKPQSSSSSEQEVQQEIESGESYEGDQYPEQGHDQAIEEKIMDDIIDNATKAKEDQQLTWNAIYVLKQKEFEINQQLKGELEKIKEKYQMLKQPIYHKISAAVLGERLQDSLYLPEDLKHQLDVKKLTPQSIEHFWGIVLDKEGLVTQEVDVDCINKLSSFKCELLNHQNNHMRITFTFKSQTDYFSNLKLEVQTEYDQEKSEPTRKIKTTINYKKDLVEHSIFTLLFDEKTDINQFYNVACEVYQDYTNALYYYFREGEEEDENQVIEVDQEQEDEDDVQDDDEVQEVQKASKKVKKDTTEKPECKQQ